MSNNKLKFKIGDFKNLWVEKQLSGGTTFEINDDIQNGDICFAKLNTSSGNFVIKDSDNLYYSMPAPGELSFPLVGKGLNQAPEYSPIIKLQEISFIHSKDITKTMGSLVMSDISSANATSAAEAVLTLGNDVERSAINKSAKGIIRIYGSGSGHGDIVYPDSSNSASFFLPCPSDSEKDNQSMFAIWRSSIDEGVGESAIPTYINENGEVVPCSGGELFSDLHIQTEGSRVSVCATIAGQVRAADIPNANQSQPGLMTGDIQFFNGTKYFYGNVSSPNLTVNPNVKNATRSIGNNNYPWNSLYCKAILIKGVCRGNTLEEGEISEEEEIIDGGTVAGTSGNSTASAPLAAYMTLGNIIPTAAIGGRYGKINLYGDGAYLTTIRTREGGATATGGQPYDGVQFLLPPGEEQNDKCYAVWSPEAATAIGDAHHPVYIDTNGKVVSCSTNLGSTTSPWKNIYSNCFTVYDEDENAKIEAGKMYVTIPATEQYPATILELGNSNSDGFNQAVATINYKNKSGWIRLYSNNGNCTNIRPRPGVSRNNVTFFLPRGGSTTTTGADGTTTTTAHLSCYATWYRDQSNGVGDSGNQLLYVASNGELCASTLDIGDECLPVHILDGQIKACSRSRMFSEFTSTPGTSEGETISITLFKNPVIEGQDGCTRTLKLDVASGSQSGVVSTGIQTFAGQKTFSGKVICSNAEGIASLKLSVLTSDYTTSIGSFFDDASNNKAHLTIGNSVASTAGTNGRTGILRIYSDNDKYSTVRARGSLSTSIANFYLPDTGTAYAVWSPNISTAVGSSTQPVYVATTGKVVACTAYAGGTALTLNGTSKAGLTASIYAPTSSGTSTYILKSNGANTAPTWIQAVPVANGGTGKTSWTANRLIYASGTTTLTTSSHYINGTKIAINYTTAEPNENLYVNGSAKILGTTTLGDAYADTITLNGKVILVNNRTYGTTDPSSNTSLGTATTGQVYFKLIS